MLLNWRSNEEYRSLKTDTASVVPWVAYAAVMALGVWLCRKSFPRAADSWNEAITEVRARMMG